jgi:hypothetical protein
VQEKQKVCVVINKKKEKKRVNGKGYGGKDLDSGVPT